MPVMRALRTFRCSNGVGFRTQGVVSKKGTVSSLVFFGCCSEIVKECFVIHIVLRIVCTICIT